MHVSASHCLDFVALTTSPNFAGRQESYEQWKTKQEDFLSDEPGVKDLLFWAEHAKDDIDPEMVESDVNDGLLLTAKVCDAQLYTLLSQKTDGVAYTMVSNVKGQGLRAWQKLAKANALVTHQTRRALLGQVLQPPSAKSVHEIMWHEENWGKTLAKYRLHSRDTLPEDVLIVAYFPCSPAPFRRTSRNRSTTSGRWQR